MDCDFPLPRRALDVRRCARPRIVERLARERGDALGIQAIAALYK
jgi:hypothetical protein